MMTPILSTEDFAALGAPDLVYVRPVKAAEIMASVPAEAATLPLHPARIRVTPPFAGRASLAVLTDRVLSVREIDVPEAGTESVH